MEKIGKYAFILGIVVAVIAGVTDASWAPAALAILGVVVGLLAPFVANVVAFNGAAVFVVAITTLIDVTKD